MLRNLKIENIAIIESASIDFYYGFNVLTGETGAGKSIIIDAINAVLGERTSKELIRTGAEKAVVFALFDDIPISLQKYLNEQDIEADNEILIQRTITVQGKNICKINGYPVNVSMLKNVAKELINIHGQHDSQSLLSPENHFVYLDILSDNYELLEEYRNTYRRLIAYKRELEKLNIDEAEKERKIELLTYQIAELERADLKIGEMTELKQKSERNKNVEALKEALFSAYNLLYGSNDFISGASGMTSDAANELQTASELYPEISALSEKIENISYELKDASDEIRAKLDSLETDTADCEAVEERLDELYRLSKKYGDTEAEMIDFLESAKIELEDITLADERREELQIKLTDEYEKAKALALQISDIRRKTADDFSKKVCEELSFLDMPNVTFSADFEKCKLNINGMDNIEFLISPNRGETPKPLAKIASGGELSRIMLAIKSVLSDKDNIDTLIFDEIDTGVSGRAADKIGNKLLEVSRGRQVICVTHLAQIASKADEHFLIEKSVSGESTYTNITPLDFNGRVLELARIMGGTEITENQKNAAKELLEKKGI
ncbi:MAG: DNA repair protein RecN [Clostridia bacterium]|nr:DNA repair protein RecN [Clostridia bacterium]